MFRQLTLAMVTLAALSAAGPVRADGGTDPMRCEARRLRCDSRRFECLVRCDHRASRQSAHSMDAATSPQTDCASTCEQRAKQAMDRIDNNPPCTVDPVIPEPRTCEARLLRVSAANFVCNARCTSRAQGNDAFDATTCFQTCQTSCTTVLGDTLASPICADGRIGTDPICAAQ
jgi:hypothetical protein